MGYEMSKEAAGRLFDRLRQDYEIFAPKRFPGEGCFSDTDVIRYGSVNSPEEIEWEKRSDYSFKEALLAINEVLFYFTEEQTQIPACTEKKLLIFLRSCDLHAVKRLDQIYLQNGPADFYYKRLRDKAVFALMGCGETCDTGFCASLGTNRTEDYDVYLKPEGDTVLAECRSEALQAYFDELTAKAGSGFEGLAAEAGSGFDGLAAEVGNGIAGRTVTPDFVSGNKETVTLPKNLSLETRENPIWEEYGSRCIGCGRCNFVCPTCTCFTMQDIFYRDNAKVGERRRVWASCQVDGYTDIAGGIQFRKSQGERLRFKVMHKIYDFEKRFGYPMCVGCGRCDDVCPEYISYANIVNKLAKEED